MSPYTFQMLDDWGFMNRAAWAEADEMSDMQVMTGDIDVASHETLEFVVAFEADEDAPLGYLPWQPEYGFYEMIDIPDEGL